MNNISENGKKFDLSQNAFVIFMFGYAPIIIIGFLIILKLRSYLPKELVYVLLGVLFIGSIIKGIMDLQFNKRTLIVSDNEIKIYLKKRKNDVLLTRIKNEEIASLKQHENEAFVINKKNGQEEIIPLSCSLKPYNILIYSVKAELYRIYGEERTDFSQDTLLLEYINTNKMPKELLDADDGSKIRRLLLIIAYIVFAGLPTIMGISVLIMLILYIILGILKGLIAILTPFATK